MRRIRALVVASVLVATGGAVSGCSWMFQKTPPSGATTGPVDCDEHPSSPTVDAVLAVLHGLDIPLWAIMASSGSSSSSFDGTSTKTLGLIGVAASVFWTAIHGASAAMGSSAANRCRELRRGLAPGAPARQALAAPPPGAGPLEFKVGAVSCALFTHEEARAHEGAAKRSRTRAEARAAAEAVLVNVRAGVSLAKAAAGEALCPMDWTAASLGSGLGIGELSVVRESALGFYVVQRLK